MDTFNTTQQALRRQKAIEKVGELKSFYTHATIYSFFVLVFISLNFFSGSQFPWAIFPIVGWGLGVLSHAAGTFDWNPFFGKAWEERKINEILENE